MARIARSSTSTRLAPLDYHLRATGGPEVPLELLLHADDLETLGVGAKGRRGIPLRCLFLLMLGYPFKWAKTRGGCRVEWLGMETEYSSYTPGMSEKRANWLADWLSERSKSARALAGSSKAGPAMHHHRSRRRPWQLRVAELP